jgi:hypothetical protein
MITIPVIVSHSGFSPGTRSQLSIAPTTGIINFQRLSSDTLTPGRCKSLYHNEKANAAIKLNHNKISQYSAGKGPLEPSSGIEKRKIVRPPVKSETELRTRGFIPLLLIETRTLLVAVAIFAIRIINTPSISMAVPNSNACLPALIRITPEIPKIIVISFFLVSLSSLCIREATTAVTSGCEPTITAPRAPGTRLIPW